MDKDGADNLNREDRFKRYTHQVRVFDARIIDASFFDVDQALRVLTEFGKRRDINAEAVFCLINGRFQLWLKMMLNIF